MKLRSLIAAGAAGLGLAAAGNRVVSRRTEPLPPALSGKHRTYRWRGMDVSYTETGDPADPDVLLLHGIHAAASNKEFDRIVDDLAEEFHVIAPDFPGFGRSDRPPLLYSGSLYAAFVADFVREVTDDPTVIASSLSSAYAVSAAREGDIARLVLICPTAQTMSGRRSIVRSALRSPVVGTALFNLLASKRSIRTFSKRQSFYDPDSLEEEDVDELWHTAHQPGARYAPASFIAGYLDMDIDLGEELAATGLPTTLVWGREARTVPLSEGRELADVADARLVVIDRARLLPHVEHPDAFVDVIREDLAAIEQE